MKLLCYFLGAIVPLPIFCNLLTGEVLIREASLERFPVEFGAPVPVGIFAVVFLGVLTIASGGRDLRLKKQEKWCFYLAALSVFLFFFVAYRMLDILRVVSLVFPFAAIYFVYCFTQSRKKFSWAIKGYIISMLAFVLFHSVSIVFLRFSGVENKTLLFSSFFGYTIYQSLVSYSAVLSFLGCSLVICSAKHGDYRQRFLLLLLGFLVFFVVGFGARRAVLLDVFVAVVAFVCLAFSSIIFSLKIHKSTIYSFIYFGCLLIYLIFCAGYIDRDLSVVGAVNERGGAYAIFWSKVSSASIIDILFGFGGRWGGHSNLFVEMIFRLGLIGIAIFLTAVIYSLKFISSYLSRRFIVFDQIKKISHHVKVWMVFLALSVISSNSVNMNLQLPYYVINIAFISLSYLYWNERSNRASRATLVESAG